MAAIYESRIDSLPLVGRGKVRDIYAVDETHLLMVASDRLSAFDVVLSQPIPGKGWVLNQLSQFWFRRFAKVMPSHVSDIAAETVVAAHERDQVSGRAVVVKKLLPLPIEAVVRGYLIGSGWKDYQASGKLCGIDLPLGLQLASRLPSTLFTPATKAEQGEHDENIDFDTACRHTAAWLVRHQPALTQAVDARALVTAVREAAILLYEQAAAYALGRGVIIADSKFEFGIDRGGKLHLIDEALTPDSSRFWPADGWRPGENPPSWDKQYVRDYLETLVWNKQAPAPTLPDAVIARTSAKYGEAYQRLTGETAAAF